MSDVVDFLKLLNPQSNNERVSINLVESSGERNTTHISLIPSFSANVTRVIKDSSVNPVFPPLQYS